MCAKVDVGSGRLSLLNGQIVLHDVRVANCCAPAQNLIAAEDCEFSLDPEALLYRRAVVRQGHVHGLEFSTLRAPDVTAEGVLPGPGGPSSKSAQVAQDWLEQLEDRFQQDPSDELQSVRLTDQLVANWPAQYSELADRVRQFHERAVDLKSQIELAQANPLRHATFLESLPDRLTALRGEFAKLRLEVDSLPDLADTQRRAIVAVRRQDEQLLDDRLQVDPIDDDDLSAYLLQQQMAGPVGDLIGWLTWMRQVVPAEPRPSPSTLGRGEDVLFAGCTALAETADPVAGPRRLGPLR